MTGLVPRCESVDKDGYARRAIEIADLSLRDAVNDEGVAYRRPRDLMKRGQLALGHAEPGDVDRSPREHGRAVGKVNDADARRFQVYDVGGPSSVGRTMGDKPDVLEEYAIQHPAYDGICGKSVSTLRIHAARSSRETRLASKPLLSMGAAGSVTDHPICDRAARVLLEEDGTVVAGADRWRCCERMDCHPDTGYPFVPGRQVPFVREAREMCRKAATRLPELRYLGWDVAVTADGNVAIEADSISGLAPKRCSASEIQAMFRFVFVGVEFRHDVLFRANRFVPSRLSRDANCSCGQSAESGFAPS